MSKHVDEAKRVGYLLVTRDMGRPTRDAFFNWCESEQRPYATLKLRETTGTVEIDFICCPRATDQMREDAEAYVRSFPFARTWSRGMFGQLSLGDSYWSIDKCPIAYAKQVMEGLIEIAVNR